MNLRWFPSMAGFTGVLFALFAGGCGIGDGAYEFTMSAPGYLPADVKRSAAYSIGGHCPQITGGTEVDLLLTPQ